MRPSAPENAPRRTRTSSLGALLLAGLLACGGGGENKAPAPAPATTPVISTFTVSPTTITTAQDVTLAWTVTGSTTLQIDPGAVPVTGTSTTLRATATTTYTLRASNTAGNATATATVTLTPTSTVRIGYLHHSTGGNIWGGGVPAYFTTYNGAHGTHYQITEVTYPRTNGGYPWANYPYDYWNLWVNHTGTQQDRGELNLDQLAAQYEVIVFKHCYPVSSIGPDSDCNPASISSSIQTIANYRMQYEALKTRMKQFPNTKFILWTGAALTQASTSPANAQRARDFFTWVKSTWDQPGDNIFLWDFFELETEGGNYLKPAYAASTSDSHPNSTFSAAVAPYIGRRIVDVIEGRGDTGPRDGK